MRIAAGVLIIVAAVFDYFAGGVYLLGGAVASAGGKAADLANEVQQLQQKQLKDMAKNQPQFNDVLKQQQALNDLNKKNVEAVADGAKFYGPMAVAFGSFLLVLAGLGIGAGVVLFMSKAPIYALIVGVLQLIAEVIPCVMFTHVGPTNIFGVVAAIFVIVAALAFYPKRRSFPVDDEDDDDRPRRRRSRDEEEEVEADEDERPRRRRPVAEDEEERPRARRPAPADEGVQERPRARRPAPPPDEDEDERPRRRRPVDDDEDEAPPPPRRRPAK